MDTEKRYLTTKEAAEFLSFDEQYLRNIVCPGSSAQFKINGKPYKPIRINRRLRWDRVAMEKLMQN